MHIGFRYIIYRLSNYNKKAQVETCAYKKNTSLFSVLQKNF